jgi:hypothetical protein
MQEKQHEESRNQRSTTLRACVVFGKPPGQRSPQAGLFMERDSANAARLAARAGMMTLAVSR